jgi:uncharacterized protein YdcH (DUF465 family)
VLPTTQKISLGLSKLRYALCALRFSEWGDEMATKEEELIERLMRENEEFLKTKQAHSQLAKQLEELEKKSFLTPRDEMEIKIIKKKKLALKDQMEKILIQYR